jgi:hypothetical protein
LVAEIYKLNQFYGRTLIAELRANKRDSEFINRILEMLAESLKLNAAMQERNMEEALVEQEKETKRLPLPSTLAASSA